MASLKVFAYPSGEDITDQPGVSKVSVCSPSSITCTLPAGKVYEIHNNAVQNEIPENPFSVQYYKYTNGAITYYIGLKGPLVKLAQ